ncbi:MAG: hypothetical protein DRJ15_08935 [Bacteroidetes bacterium]|nr:MAG: hypothetical protein DRJ15_08935 [Bacteroidota bacterium]
MKKLTTLLAATALLVSSALQAQVVLSTSPTADPHESTMLDIQSTNKGVSFPNVDISDLETADPVTSPITGLMVYNTNTTTGPGLFWWDGTNTQWVQFARPLSMPGNLVWWIRPASANYIRPEANDAVRVYDDGEPYGYYYSGNNNLVAAYFRTTNSTNGACAVQGFSDVSGNQTYGYLGYNGSITIGGSTIGGAAVHGLVEDANRTAIYGKTALNATIAAILGYSDVWIPGYFFGDHNNSSTAAYPALYGHINVNVDANGYQPAIHAYHDRSGGSGNSGFSVGIYAYANGADQDVRGIVSFAVGNWVNVQGGYFSAVSNWSSAYAYVADDWNSRKITGTNAVSEIIPTKNHGRITMTCPEAPEYWYYDYGTVDLINGKAHVEIDPILVDIIIIDEDNPLKVFLQVNIPVCEGVAVVNKSATGFDLVERNGGTHTGEIDYQIVVRPKTLFGEGRFVQAPGPDYLKSKDDPLAAKAKNQRSKESIFIWPPDYKVYGYNPEDYVGIGEIIPDGPNRGKVKLGNGKYGNKLPFDKKELNNN